ncbi:MFS transporter [Longispora sp. K20-0274]|uniref:MFS transporter n=1 Tax=Longispora sp. K20-0274 TaxID=3088255 RepID=UPI00399BB2B4
MRLHTYHHVLALPGVRTLMILALLARIPVTAAGMALTFHVLGDLHGGYAQAGLVGTAATVATALGAPFTGLLTDRKGLRVSTALGTLVALGFWVAAPFLPYPALLVAAFLGGLVGVGVFSVARQALAALVPEDQRRTAFSIDSMSTELSYMVGPALAIILATQVSPRVSMIVVGTGVVLSGAALWLLNPPTREAEEPGVPDAPAPPRRTWLRGGFVGLLLVAAATTTTLAGTEMAMVAALRQSGHTSATSVVIALWCVYSLLGAFLYGALHRGVPSLFLCGAMAVLSIPIGLVGGQWWAIALALLPAGILCAPSLSSNTTSLSALVPAAARGEAMGIQGSAMTVGMAVGAPLAGWVSDHYGPAWGFAAIGLVGLVLCLAAVPLLRHTLRPARSRVREEIAQPA